MESARFLLVDDDELVRRALCQMASRHGEAVAAGTMAEAVGQLKASSAWSAFVFDVGLPDGSGLDLLARARRTHELTPALVLTARNEGDLINRAHDLGAEYRVKPTLGSGIGRFLADAATRRRALTERVEAAVTARAGGWKLTEGEAEMLVRSALGQDRWEIADARGTSEGTVRIQIGHMTRKTGLGSLTAAIGLILRAAAEGAGSREPPTVTKRGA